MRACPVCCVSTGGSAFARVCAVLARLCCADASWLAGGDATIFECEQSSSTEDEDGTCGGSKRAKVIDMNRTGAKSAAGEQEDPKGAGAGYHSLGVLRTKVDAYLQADGQAKKTERESVCVCVCV